ncbi:vitamin K epoxide reductase family protein [Pseudonocardia halophobica]|uniref:Membrane protein n=1 Tax=Pseudonocardia halophobica TaxID=29401 RepID=A0A9W6KZH6_9PSEU|nr:membrane protein [Pseudonocardia halophobica]
MLPWLLFVGGLIGLTASFVLTVERFALAQDPDYTPTCSINPVLSCGSVMSTPQAAVFGFPNPLLGIVGFAVVTATGAALLAGGRLRGWYWLGLQGGATSGAVFVHWLIGQSLYRIGALCPYCMVVWAVTVPIFWYVTLRNLHRLKPADRRLAAVTRYHSVPLACWFTALVALIAARFWPYWSTIGIAG